MRTFPVIHSFTHTPQSQYLFLDFDGVLHPEKPPFDLHLAVNLYPVVCELGLHVVISSTWRETTTMPDLIAQLGQLGQHVVGMTPVLDESELKAFSGWKGRREAEIRIWLEVNASVDAEWVAIDDVEFLFFDNCTRLFLTNPNKGLTISATKDFESFARKIFSTSKAVKGTRYKRHSQLRNWTTNCND